MFMEVMGVVFIKVIEESVEGVGLFFTGSSFEGINLVEYDDEDEDIVEELLEDWVVGVDGFEDENWVEDGDYGIFMDDDIVLLI